MIFLLITFAVVGIIAYTWVIRGFFSALMHLACVVAAGAIALAVWEPLSYWLLGHLPSAGFFAFVRDSAWALGLALPFMAALALLRAITDKLVPANVIVDDAVNYAGGGICGLGSGILSAGILVLAVSSMRLPSPFLGYKPLWYNDEGATARGMLRRTGMPMLRVDWLTARFYSNLSLGAFATPQPLAKWYPDLDLATYSLRMTYSASYEKLGDSRTTCTPSDVELEGWYTLGNAESGSQLSSILNDAWNEGAQPAIDLDGEPISRGYVAGFVVTWYSGAKEKGSEAQVFAGNGQVRLVAQTPDGSWRTYHPLAIISHTADTQQNNYARYRYDSPRTFIASVGGASEVKMSFEFALHPGDRPIALYTRNVRHRITGQPETEYASASQRDGDVRSGRILEGGSGFRVSDIDWSEAVTLDTRNSGRDEGVRASNAIGWTIQKGNHGSLRINEEERTVTGGEMSFAPNALGQRGLAEQLRINEFAVAPGISIVQLEAGPTDPAGLLSPAAKQAPADAPPMLIDTNDQAYEAVGFILVDPNRIQIRFEPTEPIKSINELPALSLSRPDQRLTLIFRCSFGVELKGFAIGNQGIARFEPVLALENRQN